MNGKILIQDATLSSEKCERKETAHDQMDIYENKTKSLFGHGTVLRDSDNWNYGTFRLRRPRVLGLFTGVSTVSSGTYFYDAGDAFISRRTNLTA